MLDQSFSTKNFRIILDIENRKGIYVEKIGMFEDDWFTITRDISEKIREKNNEINEERIRLKHEPKNVADEEEKFRILNNLKKEKESLKVKRNQDLESILNEISVKVNEKKYAINLRKGILLNNNQLFDVGKKTEDFFVIKQIQYNICKTFKVKQTDRRIIVSQLKSLLCDEFPKLIIRTDIKKFYENIPHKELFAMIENNQLLNFPSKKIIKNILDQYWKTLVQDGIKKTTDERTGVPRGVGISAYLAELYMRNVDNKIKKLFNVTYYMRYVDDIIIVITPSHKNEPKDNYVGEIKNIIELSKLEVNNEKTKIIDFRKIFNNNEFFTYLGYKFVSADKRFKVYMSDQKLEKYKQKINIAFKDYENKFNQYCTNSTGIDRLLLQRIKLLTQNYRLVRNKSKAFVGIYYSNEFLTELDDLRILDQLLQDRILYLQDSVNEALINKLKKYSFELGFIEKRFVKVDFSPRVFRRALKIWEKM